MKKFTFVTALILVIFFNICSNQIFAQTKVFIPDTNFRNFLDTTYAGFIVGDSLLTDSAITLTGSLNCNSQAIADLTGVESFINITTLNCYNNQITSLPSLITLTALEGLYVGNNLLTSLPSLASLTALEIFYSQFNLLTTLPSLATNTALRRLACWNNQLTSLPDLSNNPAIEWIFCENNQLTSLPSLTNNTALQYLYCKNNQLTSLPDLSTNTSLSLLYCENNQLTSLPSLTNDTSLLIFYCDNNLLTSLPDLSTLLYLGLFHCNDNLLTTLPSFSGLTNLQELYCHNNQLTSLPDFTNNTSLSRLYCYNNQLTTLPSFTTNTALNRIWSYDNLLTTVPDFSSNINLDWLRIENNKLSTLPDFSSNTNLQSIYCTNNKLDFSDAKELRLADVVPSMIVFSYSPQDPFGTGDTFNLSLGDTIKMSIASQDSALSYQWFRGASIIAGATDTLLTIQGLILSDTGLYTCVSYGTALDAPPMTHGSGITSFVSEPFLISIPDDRPKTYIPGPFFRAFLNTAYPTFMDATGDSLVIDSAASFTGVFNCSSQNIEDITGIEYFVNATLLDCSNNKLDFSDARELRMVDTISSLTTFTYSPQNPFGIGDTLNLNDGDTLTLWIAIQDSALSYQWFKDGDTIVGATDTLLTIASINLTDTGLYTCRSYGTALNAPPMSFAPGIASFISEPFMVIIPDLRARVFIPDTNFRNFLNTTYPDYMDDSGDSLLIDSAAALTGTLNCSGQNIADITGIEHFVNAAQLDCSNNKLDFSDARELRMVDTFSSLTTYTYSPQNPFGIGGGLSR